MPYATQQQLIDKFGVTMLVHLTDRGPVPTGLIDAAVVARVLADADAEIDGYLAGRYALPMAVVPPVVTNLALVIAIYQLHTFEPDPKIIRDYDQAMKRLREISNGTVMIPAAGLEPERVEGSGARITDRERPFTADNLKGFI